MNTKERKAEYDPFEGELPEDPRKKLPNFTYDEEIGGGYFVVVPSAFLLMKQYSANARLLYSILLAFAGKKETAFPGMETLGEIMNCHRNTISTTIMELEEAGLLEKKRRGQGLSNLYHLKKFNEELRRKNTP